MSPSKQTTGIAIGLIFGLLIGAGGMALLAPSSGSFTITSSGSTTVLPLSLEWASRIAVDWPSLRFDAVGGGSGVGQSDAAAGNVDIGASSSFPKEDYRTANPDVHILPVSADALGVVVNEAVNGSVMKMDVDMVVAIFAGNITTWAELASEFNVDIAATGAINVYARSDASGTTATFAKWLETADENPSPYENYTWGYGDDEALDWPAHITRADGNPGVASSVQNDVDGIGYVGLAFMEGLTQVWLYNPSIGEFIEPTVENALKSLPETISDPGVNLFNSGNDGAYPIARLLFYLVNPDIVEWYIVSFLVWCLTEGQQYIPNVGYVPISGTSAADFALSVVASMSPA
jgi:phosphate transport system substrate-binding protein